MVAALTSPFDPQVHITAEELRGMGFYVSEWVPNGAYVRRVAVGVRADEDVKDESASIAIDVLEPFELVA